MAATTRFLVYHNLKRGICSSAVNCAYATRQGRFMKKLMGSDVGKRKWYQGNRQQQQQSAPSGPVAGEKLTSSHVTRRMTVLNKLFMQHITDLMATGEVAPELLGRSIEISHVKVTPDFNKVLVFWGSKRETSDVTETARLLRDCAFRLRHELTQLRVIGQVPMIEFVKNRQLEALALLEKSFKIADFGEDFEPTVTVAAPRDAFIVTKHLSSDVRRKILDLESSSAEADDEEDLEEDDDEGLYDVDLPEMRHDILGLDHSAIMKRVMTSLKKSREGARNRLLNVTTILPSTETPMAFDPPSLQSSKGSTQAFTEFLIKRQIEEKRKLRRQNKDSVLEYNMREHNDVAEEDEEFVAEVDRDVDAFEDIQLESLK